MALVPGTRFGTYEVVEPIGSGGMGEVYRATDTSLKRDVALKVLPPDFVNDSDRLARFQREAEILATLNHANIAQVFGLEKADGQTAIIMELVEGSTLADHIREGPIPPDEAMGIALQVLAALEAAHAKGIVHRDLKPANVKVTDDGIVKVLDFGISKPIDPSVVSGTPVATTPAMTQSGVILGTAAYMSPEQARGKFVDQRTDIWAFGCLLFEMLTGQPAFGGEDVMAILARVIDRDTDLSPVPTAISPSVRETIRLCLQKDAKRRIADVRDVRLALAGEFESRRQQTAEIAHPLWRRTFPMIFAVLAAVVLTWTLSRSLRPESDRPLLTQFAIDLPHDIALNGLTASIVAVSPQGDLIAYGADGSLFLRPTRELDAQRIAQTNGESPINLVFSADGRWIYYTTQDRQLKRVSIDGGSPEEIAQIRALNGPSLTDSGSILYTQGMRILSARAGGSTEPELLVSLAEEAGSRGDAALALPALNDPVLLPGGKFVLTARARPEPEQIITIEVATGNVTELFSGSRPRYLTSGHIVYFDSGSLLARTFDPDSLESGAVGFGDPETIVSGIRRNANLGSAMYEIGADGTLVYIAEPPAGPEIPGLAIVDREGRISPLDLPDQNYGYPTVSPDGRFALFFSRGSHWIYDLSGNGGEPRPFGENEGVIHAAASWLDERTMAFAWRRVDSDVMEIFGKRINAGAAELLVSGDILKEMAGSTVTYAHHPLLAPDGRLAFSAAGLGGDDIYIEALPDGKPEQLVSRTDIQNGISFSPDGRFMAYNSVVIGAVGAVVVEPFPPDGSSIQVSRPGVHSLYPVWARNGSGLGLYYQDDANATIEFVELSESMTVTDRRTVVSYPGLAGTRRLTSRYFDTIPGTDELLIRWRRDGFADTESPATRIVVFQHFVELLEDLR